MCLTGIAHVPETRRLFVETTGEKNIDMGLPKRKGPLRSRKKPGLDF